MVYVDWLTKWLVNERIKKKNGHMELIELFTA